MMKQTGGCLMFNVIALAVFTGFLTIILVWSSGNSVLIYTKSEFLLSPGLFVDLGISTTVLHKSNWNVDQNISLFEQSTTSHSSIQIEVHAVKCTKVPELC